MNTQLKNDLGNIGKWYENELHIVPNQLGLVMYVLDLHDYPLQHTPVAEYGETIIYF